MSLKEELSSQRTCSDVLSSVKDSKTSESLTNLLRARQSSASSASTAPESFKKSADQTSSSTTNLARNRMASNSSGKTQNECVADACYCAGCATSDDVPKDTLQSLKDQVRTLKSELSKERNNHQILRRKVLVAKKVVQTEIGEGRREDFDSLLKKANDETWKGRQAIILILKRKLRDLNDTVERMVGETAVRKSRRNAPPKREASVESISDERKIHRYLEQERRDVFKSGERNKREISANRDTMKNKLIPLVSRNEELHSQVEAIRDQLSLIPKQNEEELVKRLHTLESELKMNLEEKADTRRKVDDMEQQICRNCKTSAELKVKIDSEKILLKELTATVMVLKQEETRLREILEDIRRDKFEQTVMIMKKLGEVEQDYAKIAMTVEDLMELMANSKQQLEDLRGFKQSSQSVIRKYLPPCQCETRKGVTLSPRGQLASNTNSRTSIDKLSESTVDTYENKLQKYKSMFQTLDHRNEDKLKNFYHLISRTKEEYFAFFSDRYLLTKLTSEISVLKSRAKKCRKTLKYPSKIKLAKKKNSSMQLIENLDDRKMYNTIRTSEKASLKSLLKRVFASKEDDCDLLERFLMRNKDEFLRALTSFRI